MNTHGGCLCRAVRYVLSEPPVHTFFCHCTHCQKETGGPFATELYVTPAAVSLTGDLVEYTVVGDSGKLVRRQRCATCGAPLITVFDDEPAFICLKACSLDDPSWLKPEFHLYVKSKQPWDMIADDLPQYPGDMTW